MTGGVTCDVTTVMLEVAEVLFPAASVAVKVTRVVPSGKDAGASWVTVGCAVTRSVAVAAARKAATDGFVTGTLPLPPPFETVIGAGAVSRGAVVSRTRTRNVAEAVLP